MNKPVLPLPERELCDYEKLRDKNVREIEKAMAESGFFEDLNEYKKKIGFSNEIQIKEKKTNNNVKKIEPVDKIEKEKGKKRSTRSKMIRQNMKSRKKNQVDKKKEHKKEYGINEDDKNKKEVEKKEWYKKEKETKKDLKTENDNLETGVEVKKPVNTATTPKTGLRETMPKNSDCYDDIDCFHLEY